MRRTGNLGGTSFYFSIKSNGLNNLILSSFAPITETKIIPLIMSYQGRNGNFRFNFLEM
jgi:hypothetical protein